MDIDSLNNINLNKQDNYTITENKMQNTFSDRYASVKNKNKRNIRNHSIKQRRKFNLSFINLNTNNNDNNQFIEPKKYKGPIDLKCLLYSNNINDLIERISNTLKKNKMNVINLGPHKIRCTKNGQSFDIELFSIYNNNDKINNLENNIHISDNNSYIYDNESNLKTISGISNYNINKNNNFNVYYYTITSKVYHNKILMKNINKIIYSKFFLGKIRKRENF